MLNTSACRYFKKWVGHVEYIFLGIAEELWSMVVAVYAQRDPIVDHDEQRQAVVLSVPCRKLCLSI